MSERMRTHTLRKEDGTFEEVTYEVSEAQMEYEKRVARLQAFAEAVQAGQRVTDEQRAQALEDHLVLVYGRKE